MGDLAWMLMLFIVMLLIFIVAFYYEESPKFRYKFKFCFYVVYVSTVAILTVPLFLFKPRSVENMRWTVPLTRPVSKLLGITWEVYGTSVFDEEFPCVVICNHQSVLDVLGMAEIWLRMKRCAAVAKKEILYVFPFGLAAWLCGTVFIDRTKATDSRVKMSMTAEAIRKDKTKLWIFPEGTRHKGPTLLPFKKGAFHIAVQNKLPIVPVVISPYTFIDDEKPYFNSGKMAMSILPPISTEGVTNIDELIETTRDKMTTEYQRLSQIVHKYSANVSPRSRNGGPITPVTYMQGKKSS